MQEQLIPISSKKVTTKRNRNLLGLLFLPDSPFKINSMTFYLKDLCGLSILERNIKLLKKNGIKDIFLITNESTHLKNINNSLVSRLKILNNTQELKEHLIFNANQVLQQDFPSPQAIILDGSALIDNRIISALVQNDGEIIFKKGMKLQGIETKNDDAIMLGGKIDVRKHPKIFETAYHSIEVLFENAIFDPTIIHSSDELDTYKPDMRRELPLLYFTLKDPKDFKKAKNLLIKRTQKGTLDIIAWYFNRHFENLFVRLLANTRITANHITIFVNILAYITVFFFLTLNWWIGVAILILINIFDGVDGKLARLRMKESKVGHIEHSFDQLYEQAIYASIGVGSYFITQNSLSVIALIIMLLADSFSRHCSMQYKEVMGISLADSSRFDQLFRRFDGRRNIYTLHVLVWGIFGLFELIIFSMCIHAIITSIIYSIQAIRHMKKNEDGNYGWNKE
ncbi:MAG: CDP-alcohol phosphatidyltransferase family protein [Promethearchaeota archaeon]